MQATLIAGITVAVATVTFGRVADAQTPPRPPAPAVGVCSKTGGTITAEALVQCLSTQAVDGADLTVDGTVDLTKLGTVDHPIRCHDCVINGDLRVTDVTFNRAIDLDGLRVDGDVDARGATFKAAVFATGDRSAKSGVTGSADFAFATFNGAATFDGLNFGDRVDFSGARFSGSVTLIGSDFANELSFERAVVGGFFVLSGPAPEGINAPNGRVAGPTNLRDATFSEVADLSSRWFVGGLDASGVNVAGRFNLEKSRFGTDARSPGLTIDGATLTELDAGSSTFVGPADIQEVRAGSVDLSGASAQQGLRLDGTAVTGAATLRGASVSGTLGLGSFTASDFVLDIGALGNVASPQARRAILDKIEQTARASGDIPLANDARFRLLQIDGTKGNFLHRATDWVFYEQLAGYLVRPLRPLRALLLLIILGTIARYIVDWRREQEAAVATVAVDASGTATLRPSPGASRPVRTGHHLTNFLQRLSRAVIASLRPKPNIASPVGADTVEPYVIAGLRLFEYVASKLLLVVFFLSLGNYNATLRDVLGSVKL